MIVRILCITTLATSLHATQLQNKQFIFGPVRVSPALARLSAIGTVYGGWKLLEHADTAWLSQARSSVNNAAGKGAMGAGIFLAKAAVLAIAAERVYDYTRTVANYATWPAYAARLLQFQINELFVVTSLYNDVVVRASALDESTAQTELWQQLLNKYKEHCQITLSGLMDIGWYVGDEVTVQLLEALRHDLDALDIIKLDRFEIMNIMRHDELLYMRLQSLYAVSDHVAHAKDALRTADIHACYQELQVLYGMFNALYDTRAAALTDALHHCNRIASAKTTKDVCSGVLQYAQWRVSNWLESDN